MRGTALLAIAGLCCFAASARADDFCRTKWNAQLGEHATGVMWATSGERCTADIYTGYGLINSLKISAPAKVGVVTADGRSNFSYISKRGFVGRDTFTVAIDGQAPDGARGVTTVAFTVVVSR